MRRNQKVEAACVLTDPLANVVLIETADSEACLTSQQRLGEGARSAHAVVLCAIPRGASWTCFADFQAPPSIDENVYGKPTLRERRRPPMRRRQLNNLNLRGGNRNACERRCRGEVSRYLMGRDHACSVTQWPASQAAARQRRCPVEAVVKFRIHFLRASRSAYFHASLYKVSS